jgi:Ca2+-binding RTX toxin-like protein
MKRLRALLVNTLVFAMATLAVAAVALAWDPDTTWDDCFDFCPEVNNWGGSAGKDLMNARGLGDSAMGADSADHINLDQGDDDGHGDGGPDDVRGEDGNDNVQGEEGADDVYGGAHADILYGDANDDNLFGGDGDDELHGGDGDDVLNGGNGNDTCIGGAGSNTLISC